MREVRIIFVSQRRNKRPRDTGFWLVCCFLFLFLFFWLPWIIRSGRLSDAHAISVHFFSETGSEVFFACSLHFGEFISSASTDFFFYFPLLVTAVGPSLGFSTKLDNNKGKKNGKMKRECKEQRSETPENKATKSKSKIWNSRKERMN